jgi:PKD repeat protein
LINLKALIAGALLFVSASTNASTFTCPVPTNFQNLSCEGSIEVKSLSDLIAYKNNLAQHKGRAKNLIIDFDLSTNALTISTPCNIRIAERRGITSSADICLHASQGIIFSESSSLRANNVRLESNKNVIFENHADIKVDNLEMVSLGNTEDSRAHIRESAKVDAKNLLLEAFDRVSLGANSTYKVTESIKLYSRGDDDASINSNTQITTSTFELMAYDKARLANNVSIKADTAIINGKTCSIINKNTVITAANKLGNCLLQSNVKNNFFTADQNKGFAPLKVNFDSSKIKSTSFVWSFGDGGVLTTPNAHTSYTYNRPGNFTATLKYLEGKNYKSAGGIQITVVEKPIVIPTANLICSTNNLLVSCSGLASFDPQGQPLAFTFNYADGFSETNLTGLSRHAYSLPGLYTVTMTISNLAALTAQATFQVQPMLPPNVLPTLVLNCSSTKPNSLDCESIGSVDTDGSVVSLQYSYDDGISETKADTSKVTHSFLSGGSHVVTLTAVDNDGGVSTLAKSFSVLQNSNPIADFTCTSNKPYQVSCQSTTTDVDVSAGVDVFTEYDWGLQNKIIATTTSSTLDYNFQSGGDFVISLSVKDSYGGIGIVSKKITVKDNAPPLANFVCTNTSVRAIHCASTATDSDGVIASTAWVLDDGTNLSGLSFDHTFLNDQAHAVNLLVTDDLGASSSSIQTIQPIKNQAPLANFVCTNTGVRTVHCLSSSSDIDGTIATTTWSLDDGANPTGISFDHTFLDDQAHTINLLVTDNLGASTSSIQTIRPIQNQAPQGDIGANTLTGVAPLAVNFTAQNVLDVDGTITNIAWNFSDGTSATGPTVAHTFNNIGSFTAKMSLTDNLGAVTTKSVTITTLEALKAPPQAFFKYFQDGTYLDLHATLTKTQFDFKQAYYTVDNNKTIALTEFYPNTINTVDVGTYGPHTITLTVVDVRGQVGTFTQAFTLQQDPTLILPFVSFKAIQSSPLAVFLNFNASFTSDPGESISKFHVEYGNGIAQDITNDTFATYTYPKGGNYQIKVTAITTRGTQAFATRNIAITNTAVPLVQPVAAFGYRIYDIAQNVTFYNEKSGSPNGGIISYLWDFGDGQTGTGERAAHFYEPGSYFVTLTVIDFAGYTSSQVQHVTVSGVGDDIVAHLSCSDLGDKKLDCSVVALDKFNEINHLKIDWGDNTNELVTTVVNQAQGFYDASHQYATGGDKNVTLTVGTTRGVSKSTTKMSNLFVQTYPPVALLNCSTYNMIVNCNSFGSYDPKGTQLSFKFDYGDSFTQSNIEGLSTHAYTAAGLYSVTLTVTNANGDITVAKTQVQPLLPPNILPTPILACYSNTPYTLKCNSRGSTDSDGSIVSYKFDWDDNTSDTHADGQELFHIFPAGGSHQVTLTVTDNDGGQVTITNSFDVRVNHPPVANITCSSPGPQRVSCYSNSYDPDFGDQIVEYKWDLGNGIISTGMIPSVDYTYPTSSTYTVSLNIKDSYGAMALASQDVTTKENQAPIANINCFITMGSTYQCNSNAFDPDGSIVESTWSIEGQTFSGLSALYDFMNGGDKVISFTAKDNLGKMTTANITITINKPNANFDCAVVDTLKVLCSIPVTTNLDNIILSKFIFDDKDFKIENPANYEFKNFGLHKIKLELTRNDGVVAVFEKSIQLNQVYLIPKPNFSSLIGIGYSVQFNASESLFQGRIVSNYSWNFGDGSSDSSTGWLISHRYTATGNYNITLTVKDEAGNSDSISKQLYIYDPEVLDPKDANNDTLIGIDSDGDGVRDDIQRWINFEAEDNVQLKISLKNLAKNWQELMLNTGDLSKSQDLFIKNQKLGIYLYGVLDNDVRSANLIRIMKFLYFRTEERYQALLNIQSNSAGASILGIPATKTERLNIMVGI